MESNSTEKKTHHYTKHLKEQREYPEYLIESVTAYVITQLPIITTIVDEYNTNEFISKESWEILKNICTAVHERDNGDIQYIRMDETKLKKCKYLSNNSDSTLYNVREKARFGFVNDFLKMYNGINESTKKPDQLKTMIMLNIITHIYYLLTETEK